MTNKTKILTEGTPNPNALKFVVDKVLLEKGSISFESKAKSTDSALVSKLFEIKSVENVLIGKNFITITKKADEVWDNIYEKIIGIINSYIESGKPIIEELKASAKDEPAFGGQTSKLDFKADPVEEKIREILDNQIRPAVMSDGGDIIFESYENGVLKLHLQGACSSCPSSIMTLKAGVEQLLKRAVPELKEVIAV